MNNEKFNINYNDHIDLSVLKIDDDIYIESSVFDYYSKYLSEFNLKKVDVSNFKNGEMVLNIAKNKKYFFHNEKFTTKEIFEKLKLNREYLKINQGYANCSMICFENHIITSDEGVYKTLKAENIDVELVTNEGIILKNVLSLFNDNWNGELIRGIGARVSNLRSIFDKKEIDLFSNIKMTKAEEIMNIVNNKFEKQVLKSANQIKLENQSKSKSIKFLKEDNW